jgi:hypothetical protein
MMNLLSIDFGQQQTIRLSLLVYTVFDSLLLLLLDQQQQQQQQQTTTNNGWCFFRAEKRAAQFTQLTLNSGVRARTREKYLPTAKNTA